MKTATHTTAHSNSLLVVDGPNLDGGISSLLHRKPGPSDRPDFSRLPSDLETASGLRVVRKVYVTLRREEPSFHRFCATMRGPGFDWLVLVTDRRASASQEDPSDLKAIEVLRSAVTKGYRSLVIITHDHGFCPVVRELMAAGVSVALYCFKELLHRDFDALIPFGLIIRDLREVHDKFRDLDPNGDVDIDEWITPPSAEDEDDHMLGNDEPRSPSDPA